MKKALSSQLIAILLIPVLIILFTAYYIITYTRTVQMENLTSYCSTTIDNIDINIESLTTSMKKTATLFSSQEEIQGFLASESVDSHNLQRQSFFDLIDLSKSYTTDLVDVLVWNESTATSLISYIPSNLEHYAVEQFQNTAMNSESYFEFYLSPDNNQPYVVYFTPVYMTTYSSNFGSKLGNLAVICNSQTLSKLVNSTNDMELHILNDATNQVLYSNTYTANNNKTSHITSYKTSQTVPNTNLSIQGTVYIDQMAAFGDQQFNVLFLLAILSLFYVIYIALSVQYIIIRPIHRLNSEIESIDYNQDVIQLNASTNNEIGSIASHVNRMLARISSLNKHSIESQARLYEMEISKKQTQLYAYQSQINPHFLYNMLQCMRGISLMHGITEVAQICTNMAELFRYSIKGAFLVDLETELDIIDKYLDMIRIRFQNRITYNLEVAEETKKCKIPKMILQPIVENAIFHGLESIEDHGFLKIRSYIEGDELYISVQDNGVGFTPETLQELNDLLTQDIPGDINATFNESKGLGIINIHNKIRLYEGPQYGISIESYNGFTNVILHLNTRQTP